MKIAGCLPVCLQHAAALLHQGVVIAILRQGKARTVCQAFYGLHIVKVVHPAHEGDRVAPCATTKAVEGLGFWINREGGRFLVVKGAQPRISSPAPPEVHIRRNNLFNINFGAQLL